MFRFSRLMSSKPSRIWSYGVAVLLLTSAMIISLGLTPYIGFPGTLFLCVVMLSAWFGGVGPGVLATTLSALAFHYSFLHPISSLGPQPREMPRLIMYIVSNLIIGLLSAAQRTGTDRLGELTRLSMQRAASASRLKRLCTRRRRILHAPTG